ncbi:MAG: glycerol-3-phosphate responsive antiterminator [Clostridiales bacterium]|nr:glycerol-3-phosphate responsive antiterminator [Bacillota bacterium]MEE0517199.1 glycerol-3-phosphate responsive antiterminator [Anaerovoracaceae bacterium]PWL95328.1 MAG: glycerol-3-phosphate responsive antiterminator [Clostridiales bacterium]
MSVFSSRKVAAAVRTREDFEIALKSKVDVIFLLYSSIMTMKTYIDKCHGAKKKIFIHMDFVEGIGKDRAGLEFLKTLGADGILTTKTNMIRPAKDLGLVTVQRFFIVDSHSVDTAVESIRIAKPDVVEIMPGVVSKKIKEFANKVSNDILAGGLVEFKEDVDSAIAAGATAVSTADRELWNYR